MKKKLSLLLFCIVFFTNAIAQESKFVGTWMGIYKNFFTDYKERVIIIRISQIDGEYQVRVKDMNLKDSTDCNYENGCYNIVQVNNTLQWNHKVTVIGDAIKGNPHGAFSCEIIHFSRVIYSGGALYYTSPYWAKEKWFDENRNVIFSKDASTDDFPEFRIETVLYKDDYKW